MLELRFKQCLESQLESSMQTDRNAPSRVLMKTESRADTCRVMSAGLNERAGHPSVLGLGRLPGCMVGWLRGYLMAWLSDSPLCYPAVGPATWPSSCLARLLPGCVAIRLLGCLDAWLLGWLQTGGLPGQLSGQPITSPASRTAGQHQGTMGW